MDYEDQLKLKQNLVLDLTAEYQKKAIKQSSKNPLLNRQTWLKPDQDLRLKVNPIEFLCNNEEVREEVRATIADLFQSKASKDSMKITEETPSRFVCCALCEEEFRKRPTTVEAKQKQLKYRSAFKDTKSVKRNKSEFTFGIEGNKIVVGYFISRNEEKQEWKIGRDRKIGNNSELSHWVADTVESIINFERSKERQIQEDDLLGAYNYYTKQGSFRYMVIR